MTARLPASVTARGPAPIGMHDSAHLASLKVFTLPDAIVEQIKQAGSEDPNWKAKLEAVHDKSENVDPDFSIDASGMLLFDNCYILPDNQALKLRVLMANHDSM